MGKTRWLLSVAVVAAASLAPAEVTFELREDSLTTPPVTVAVAGSFNEWSQTAAPMLLENSVWRATVALADGRHEYKFFWRDAGGEIHWLNDPANPYLADNGENGANNVVAVLGGVAVAPTGPRERFDWTAPEAKWVCVAGDFNDWYLGQFRLVRSGERRWVAYLPIRRPFAYKFIIDGLWECDLKERAEQIPNGQGGLNSYRPQADPTDPAVVTIERTVAAGDAKELDAVSSYAASCDYGRAVALARKVAEVNAAAAGSTAPLVLRALDLEAGIQKRWNRWADAAQCWQRLADVSLDTDETRRGTRELAAYYLYVLRDNDKGRRVIERAIERSPGNGELIWALMRWLNLNLREGNVREALEVVENALATVAPPEGQSKQYACDLTELWLCKGACHNRLGQKDKAAEAFRKVIEIHPWSDSQNAQRARMWLERNGYAVNP